MTHCAYCQIEYTLTAHVSGTKSDGFGLIKPWQSHGKALVNQEPLTYLHGRVVGDMPRAVIGGVNHKSSRKPKRPLYVPKILEKSKRAY